MRGGNAQRATFPAKLRSAGCGNLRLQFTLCVALLVSSVSLHAQHLHVQISHGTAGWRLFVFDFDSGAYEAGDAPFLVNRAARGTVPNDPAYTNFLGAAGGFVWILPEIENPNLPYLGLGTQGIAPGAFVNNEIRLVLKGVNGPGHFALYTTDSFGGPQVRMNSRDGIGDAADSFALPASGGHAHANWAFSAPGVHQIHFAAEGRLVAGSQFTQSAPVTYTFIVLPLPPVPPVLAAPVVTANGAFAFTVSGETGRLCRVRATTDFSSWQSVTNFPMTSQTQTVVMPALPGVPRRFFQASLE